MNFGKEKPLKVLKAQRKGNREELSQLGSAGARARAANAPERAAEEARLVEQDEIHAARTEELRQGKTEHDKRLLESQEHIVPVDPDEPKIPQND